MNLKDLVINIINESFGPIVARNLKLAYEDHRVYYTFKELGISRSTQCEIAAIIEATKRGYTDGSLNIRGSMYYSSDSLLLSCYSRGHKLSQEINIYEDISNHVFRDGGGIVSACDLEIFKKILYSLIKNQELDWMSKNSNQIINQAFSSSIFEGRFQTRVNYWKYRNTITKEDKIKDEVIKAVRLKFGDIASQTIEKNYQEPFYSHTIMKGMPYTALMQIEIWGVALKAYIDAKNKKSNSKIKVMFDNEIIYQGEDIEMAKSSLDTLSNINKSFNIIKK